MPQRPGQMASPELIALMIQASRETVNVSLPSRALAVQLRARIHSARKALRNMASRPNAEPAIRANAVVVEQVETSIKQDPVTQQWILMVGPRDAKFIEAIKQAGVDLSKVDISQLTEEQKSALVGEPPSMPVGGTQSTSASLVDKFLREKKVN